MSKEGEAVSGNRWERDGGMVCILKHKILKGLFKMFYK